MSACSRRCARTIGRRSASGPIRIRCSTLDTGRRFAELCAFPEPEVIANASHFLQEDAGEQIGRRIAEWLGA